MTADPASAMPAAKDDIEIPGKIPYIVIIIDELADLMWATLRSSQLDFDAKFLKPFCRTK
jgi:hypothetical protein